MIGREDIESFLIQSELEYEEVDDGIWVVRPEPGEDSDGVTVLVISYQPPVLLLRSAVRRAPDDEESQLRLFRRLLELNADELVHGAYGLEDSEVVLTDTLELEDLDFSEFRASVEGMTLALTSHRDQLTSD